MGCVGKDKYSQILEDKARSDGVDVRYQYTNQDSTGEYKYVIVTVFPLAHFVEPSVHYCCEGTCAVLLTGDGCNRSLCANLAAANYFTKDHIDHPGNRKIIEDASCYYITVSMMVHS